MSSPQELSPHLEDVRNRFLANLTNGGIPAVRQMVDSLALEAKGIAAFDDVASEIQHDAIISQGQIPDSKVLASVDLARGVTIDHVQAVSRHSYAVWLLEMVEPQTE